MGPKNSYATNPKRPVKKGNTICTVNKKCTMFKKLQFMYTNADQLSNKITELELRVQEHLPHIIGITEVKPKNSRYSMNEAEFSLEDTGNYKMY